MTDSYRRAAGLGLTLGFLAGLFFVANRRAVDSPRPRLVNWRRVRATAAAIARRAPDTHSEHTAAEWQARYAEWVRRSEGLIAEYSGVRLPRSLGAIHVFDRVAWIDANVEAFGRLFEPLEELYASLFTGREIGNHVMGRLNQAMLSGQLGLLLGYMAQRVLGQYDLALLGREPIETGRLYFVEPNIAAFQQKLRLPSDSFRLWIALHETTHAFEFEAFPWVRDYMNELLASYFRSLGRDLLAMRTDRSALGALTSRVAGNLFSSENMLELVMSEDQRAIFRRLQALMCVVEGYSNHVMQAVGQQTIPGYTEMKARFDERARQRSAADRLFARLTGLDVKLEQYALGEAFVNEVVRRRGIAFANQVWRSPEYLPTLDEVRQPARWIARVGTLS